MPKREIQSVVMELGKWGLMPPRLDGHFQYSNGLIFEWGLKTGPKSLDFECHLKTGLKCPVFK